MAALLNPIPGNVLPINCKCAILARLLKETPHAILSISHYSTTSYTITMSDQIDAHILYLPLSQVTKNDNNKRK